LLPSHAIAWIRVRDKRRRGEESEAEDEEQQYFLHGDLPSQQPLPVHAICMVVVTVIAILVVKAKVRIRTAKSFFMTASLYLPPRCQSQQGPQ
jgi:hypothetical protein